MIKKILFFILFLFNLEIGAFESDESKYPYYGFLDFETKAPIELNVSNQQSLFLENETKPLKNEQIKKSKDYPFFKNLLFILGILFFYGIYRINKKEEVKSINLIELKERMFSNLESIKSSNLDQNSKYQAMILLLKEYMESFYGFPTFSLTTEEFFDHLKNLDLLDHVKNENLITVLKLSDLINYAKKNPREEDCCYLYKLIKDLFFCQG